jgi:hypothetical protein
MLLRGPLKWLAILAFFWVILPLFHRHLVKRFNSLSEVNNKAEGKRETEPAAL